MRYDYTLADQGCKAKEHDRWLCIKPVMSLDSDFFGYTIFEPNAPLIAHHPVWVFTGEGFEIVEGMTTDIPPYGHRFQSYHIPYHHSFVDDDLYVELERRKRRVEDCLKIKTIAIFLGSLMGLFSPENDKLECILELEEKMIFDFPSSHSCPVFNQRLRKSSQNTTLVGK